MILEGISKGNVIKYLSSLEIDCESKVAVVGKNGRGKTTLLRILSGNILPDSGNIIIKENKYSFPIGSINSVKFQRKIRENVLYIENQNYLYQNLTCEQNIDYYMSLGNFDKKSFFENLNFLEFNISDLNRRIEELSLGTKQKISISFAIASGKSIAMLDEPTLGLDIDAKSQFLNMLDRMKGLKGIVVSTNDVTILNEFDLYLFCEDEEVKMLYDNPYI
ncbi:MAG: ATP-binding cassette domain-containing protein [Lachnospiraceae bacterium]|nr:ATP-binding cassette domain-containing protein [Lachnospiraceae bacterium]